MGQLARFDTNGLSPAERLAGWGEFISLARDRLRTEPCGGQPFAGSISAGAIGALRVFRIVATPHRLERPVGAPGECDTVRIVIQNRGTAILSQGGHDILLEPGCWAAWSTNRAHTVTNLSDVEQFGLLIPRACLGVNGAEILAQAGNRLGDRPGVGKLLPAHVAHLFEQIEAIDPAMHGEIADIVTHIVRLAIIESRGGARRVPMRETMRGRVADYVRHHLRDPDLSIDRLAAHFGCTKRHLHKVFSDGGVTLSQFVWNERLDRCRSALVSPETAGRSLTEIAFAWGFNNSAHFSKAFKERFGSPPGQWRAKALAAARTEPALA